MTKSSDSGGCTTAGTGRHENDHCVNLLHVISVVMGKIRSVMTLLIWYPSRDDILPLHLQLN